MTALLFSVLLLARPAAAAAPAEPRDSHALTSYAPDMTRPLDDRVSPIPGWLLDQWRDADETPAYADHALTRKERREFKAALDGLPPRMRDAMSERMIAFYFVKNLKGNGVTSWVLDASSRTFTYMILNPAAFDKTLSEVLTERERSVYRGAADVSVDAGPGGSGILYTVAHECTHAYDFARGLTPFTDAGEAKRLGVKTPASWGVWESYAQPLPEYDFPARAKLHFYGFAAPELDAADASDVCDQLFASPFSSLYGSRSWAEDAAELFVAYHLTRDLKRPFLLNCGGKTYDPMSEPRVARRAERVLAPMLAGGAMTPAPLPAVNFREAHAEEAGELARFQIALALESEALRLDPAACERGVRAVFEDPAKGRWYAATVGHELAASLLVTPEWSDWFNGTIWWIQSVYVLPVHRGRRVFSGLYGFVKALASIEPTVRGLRLYVDKRNAKAMKVYEALGMNGEHYALYEWMKG